MGGRFARCRCCFRGQKADEAGAGLRVIKKNAIFASADISHDITPLLKADPTNAKTTDSSEGDFEQKMIATMIQENPNADDEP